MKKSAIALMIMGALNLALADDWKASISKGANDVMQYSKDAYTDIKDTISGDPKSSNFINVTTSTAFAENVTFEIFDVKPLDNQQYELNLGFKTTATKPVRLMDLYDDREVMLLDGQGFAYPLAQNIVNGAAAEYIVIPSEAGIRVKWIFSNVEAKPATLRIFGEDFPIEVSF